VWLETDQGIEWDCGDDSEKGLPSISEQDMIEYVATRYVYLRADEFSNDRITLFLQQSQ